MKLSRFLAEHIIDRDDFCVGDVCDTLDYEAMLELMSGELADGIIAYQKYLAELNTSRYSVAVWALQQIEALSKMELEQKKKPLACPIGKYTDKDSSIVDSCIVDIKRCDYTPIPKRCRECVRFSVCEIAAVTSADKCDDYEFDTLIPKINCTQACFLALKPCSEKFNNALNYGGAMKPESKPKLTIDHTCLIHGKKMSEHPSYGCLYCCLCFKSLTPEECNIDAKGKKEDVCVPCAKRETEQMEANKLKKDEDQNAVH